MKRPAAPQAFTIEHSDSPLAMSESEWGANLILNYGFETGDFTSWPTHTNWTIVSYTTPPVFGTYGAQANSSALAGTWITANLETARVAVTGSAVYRVTVSMGQAEEVGNADPLANSVKLMVNWYDNLVGGTLLRSDILYWGAMRGDNATLTEIRRKLTAPPSAVAASIRADNNYNSDTAGNIGGTILDRAILQKQQTTSSNSLLESVRHTTVSHTLGFKNLTYGSHYQSGFKACEFDLLGSAAEQLRWANDALGHEIVIRHASGKEVWRGLVFKMAGSFNGVPFVSTYENVFSRYRIPWGKPNASQQYYPLVLPSIKARYGDKIYTEQDSQDTKRDARRAAKQLSTQFALPSWGDVDAKIVDHKFELRVVCIGKFGTLDFIRGVPIPGQLEQSMEAAIATAPNSLLNVARARGNNFISADYSMVYPTGQMVGPSKSDAAQSASLMDLISHYVAVGGGNGEVLISGVWDNDLFVLRKRSNATTYYVAEDGETWSDAAGIAMSRAFIRAGEFYRSALPIPSMSYFPTAEQDIGKFITEASYETETGQVKLTTVGARTIDRRLARLIRKQRQTGGGGWKA